MTPGPALIEQDRTAWLIEMESDCLSRGSIAWFGIHYWHPTKGFSHEIDEALQFARKQDAEAFKREFKLSGKVVEHMWPATLQGSAALPSEAQIEAGLEALREHTDRYFDGSEVVREGAVEAIYTAMRATTPTTPDNMGPQGEDHPFNPANDPDAPVQDDDAELIERIDQRIAEHRAHLAALQAKYGRGVVPDERNAGLVIGFGDLLDLRSRLSPTPETGLVEALTPREMSDEAKTGATVLVYFKRHGWLSVEWNNRFIDYGEPITPENGIWCVNDHKNEVWHLRGYNEGDDTHWMPLPKPPALSNVLPDEV